MKKLFLFCVLFFNFLVVFASSLETIKIDNMNVMGDLIVNENGKRLFGINALKALYRCYDSQDFMKRLKEKVSEGNEEAAILYGAIASEIFPKAEKLDACDFLTSCDANKPREEIKKMSPLLRAIKCRLSKQYHNYIGYLDDIDYTLCIYAKLYNLESLKKIRSSPVGENDEINFALDLTYEYTRNYLLSSSVKDKNLKKVIENEDLYKPEASSVQKERIKNIQKTDPLLASYAPFLEFKYKEGVPVPLPNQVQIVKKISQSYSAFAGANLILMYNQMGEEQRQVLSDRFAFLTYLLDRKNYFEDGNQLSFMLSMLVLQNKAEEVIVLLNYIEAKCPNKITLPNAVYIEVKKEAYFIVGCEDFGKEKIKSLEKKGKEMAKTGIYTNERLEKQFFDSLKN